MNLRNISLKKLDLIIIAAGVIIVFVLSGFQTRNLYAPGITEEAIAPS